MTEGRSWQDDRNFKGHEEHVCVLTPAQHEAHQRLYGSSPCLCECEITSEEE